MVLSTKKGKFY